MKNPTQTFHQVLNLEAQSILKARENLCPREMEKATEVFETLFKNKGSLFCIGVGKSGFIAKKIASTFNSLGLTSSFLHPTEALHGDLGLIRENDAAIIISNSGTTEEIMKLLPFLPIKKEALIGLIGNANSPLAEFCHAFLNCHVEKEACLNNQAPTASTTVALAMGDALAVIYEDMTGLTKEGFAKNHPGGKLGKSLSLKVKHLMTPADECPLATPSDTLIDVLLKMTKKPMGMCAIIHNKQFLGILVEGDIRRILAKDQSALQKNIDSYINKNPIMIDENELAARALELMEKRKSPISVLPVLSSGEFKGIIRVHDLFKAGL